MNSSKVYHTLLNKINNDLIKMIQEYNINVFINTYLNELIGKTVNLHFYLNVRKYGNFSLSKIRYNKIFKDKYWYILRSYE